MSYSAIYNITGEELLLTGLAEAGDPDFQFYWRLANSEEGAELKQADYGSAMQALLVPGNFLFGAKAMSIDSVLSSKVEGLELHFLQVELTSINAILLPKGSPLTRMMNQGKPIRKMFHFPCYTKELANGTKTSQMMNFPYFWLTNILRRKRLTISTKAVQKYKNVLCSRE